MQPSDSAASNVHLKGKKKIVIKISRMAQFPK